jgi:hypothetical protein
MSPDEEAAEKRFDEFVLHRFGQRFLDSYKAVKKEKPALTNSEAVRETIVRIDPHVPNRRFFSQPFNTD